MKVMKWSAIALAVSAGSTQFAVADAFVSDQAEAKGFIEGRGSSKTAASTCCSATTISTVTARAAAGTASTGPKASSPPMNPASPKAPWASASMPSATSV